MNKLIIFKSIVFNIIKYAYFTVDLTYQLQETEGSLVNFTGRTPKTISSVAMVTTITNDVTVRDPCQNNIPLISILQIQLTCLVD